MRLHSEVRDLPATAWLILKQVASEHSKRVAGHGRSTGTPPMKTSYNHLCVSQRLPKPLLGCSEKTFRRDRCFCSPTFRRGGAFLPLRLVPATPRRNRSKWLHAIRAAMTHRRRLHREVPPRRPRRRNLGHGSNILGEMF